MADIKVTSTGFTVDDKRLVKWLRVEMCMDMGTTGIPWDSHGNVSDSFVAPVGMLCSSRTLEFLFSFACFLCSSD